MIEKKTNTTIQVMRGLAVIMVVLQHSISRVAQTSLEFRIMYFFNHIDVAVFFIIAGALFEMKKTKYYHEHIISYIKSKFRTLLIPYLFWSLILAVGIKIISLFFNNIENIIGIKPWTWKEILVNTVFFKNYNVQHLWFIYVLFFFFVFNRIFKEVLINVKVFIVILAVSSFLNYIGINYILDKFVLHFSVFLLGRLIIRYSMLRWLKNRWVKIVFSCILLLCFFTELFVQNSFTYTYLGNTVYALAGVYCVYWVSESLVLAKGKNKLRQGLKKIGDYSFEIYLIHNPYVSMSVPLLFGKIMPDSLIVIITTIIGVMFPYYFAKAMNRYTNLTVILFGRRRYEI